MIILFPKARMLEGSTLFVFRRMARIIFLLLKIMLGNLKNLIVRVVGESDPKEDQYNHIQLKQL